MADRPLNGRPPGSLARRARGSATWAAFAISLVAGAALVRQVELRRAGEAREGAERAAVALAHRVEVQVEHALAAARTTAAVLGQTGGRAGLTALAGELVPGAGPVRSLFVAPGGIVSEVQPADRAEPLLQSDLRELLPGALAERLAAEGRAGTAGPFSRGGGGAVLLGVLPVRVGQGAAEGSFWGFAGVEIALRELLGSSDAAQLPAQGYEYEVFAEGAGRPILVGRSSERVLLEPVSAEARLPDGRIRVSVVPRLGWRDPAALATEALLAVLLASLVALAVRGLVREPERLRQQVEVRRRRLSEATRQLQDEVEQRRLAERREEFLASHDVLTGLPNRVAFMRQVEAALEFSRDREDVDIAILVVDLDRFKNVNDSLGQEGADRLLDQLARRLSSCQRPGNLLARIGGDEFALLLSGVDGAAGAVAVAERLLHELEPPFAIGDQEVIVGASIGVALATRQHESAEELFGDADTALRRAKALGRGRHSLFDPGMRSRTLERLHLETALRRAIEREELVVYYQPIVALETGRIDGFESLVRWMHPERGLIPPVDFIPLAEESGLILWIDRWVLGQATRQLEAWQARFGGRPSFASVNLSRGQLVQPGLVEQVADTLRDAGLQPGSVKLEITESAVMENPEMAIECLHGLRSLGVGLSVDDFGTGYSSLGHLHSFPFHTVKIDQSFVRGRELAHKDVAILETIIRLCGELQMAVVAEGIETEEQLQALRGLGCGLGQGYLFSRPLEAPRMEELLERDPRW